MRTFLPLLLTIASVIPAISQVPDYLNNNPKWRVHLLLDSTYPCLETYNYVEYVKGDTTIGAFSYKIIHSKGIMHYTDFSGGPIPCGSITHYDWFLGFVRQDSMKFYLWNGSADQLFYDFNLQIGDTINNWQAPLSDGWFVTSQDSVLINGNYHLMCYLRNANMDSTYLLEGVGGSAGLFGRFPTFFEDDAHLICYSQNNVVEWQDPGAQFATCNFDVGTDELTVESAIDIYPNPATDRLQIVNRHSQKGEINVYDATGNFIGNWQILPNQTREIDLGAVSEGLYLVRLTFEPGITITKKLIITSE